MSGGLDVDPEGRELRGARNSGDSNLFVMGEG